MFLAQLLELATANYLGRLWVGEPRPQNINVTTIIANPRRLKQQLVHATSNKQSQIMSMPDV